VTHLNQLSKVYLQQISEALTPEQRAAAQEILNKETGVDKKKEEMRAKKKRSEIRKEKELELKQANLDIRKRREDRRDQSAKDRESNKGDQEKRDALKTKQRDLAKKVGEKSRAASGASKAAKASLASVKPKETITDKDGDGTALGKLGANVARAGAGVAGATLNTVKSIRLRQQAKKTQGTLDKTKVQEDTLLEVDEMDSKEEKTKKVIDVMRGKNKVEVNPKLKAEEVEIVNEVSKKTLGSYVKKAATEIGTSAMKGDYKKMQKRHKGVLDASDKMTKEEVIPEAKVDKGRSDYGKASIRNYRRMGPGHDDPGMFDPSGKRGKTIEKRKEEHKARRGVKGAKVPAYKKEEVEVDESMKQARKNVGASTCWDGYKAKGTKKKGGKVVPNCVKETISDWRSEVEEAAAWTKKAGKNKEGGLNEKGRKSYERENPGSDLKAPQPEGGSRKKSFCARMGGMKKKLTSSKTANDPDSRINKALRKWKCNEEDQKRDEYGDLIGGPKISKKQLKKNLAKNEPDEKHTTTTSEGSSYGLYKGSGKPSGAMAAFTKKDKDKKKKKMKEDVTIQDAKGRDFLEIIDIVKPQPMKSPKNNVQWTEEKIVKLMKKANEKKRKNALQINKIVGTQ